MLNKAKRKKNNQREDQFGLKKLSKIKKPTNIPINKNENKQNDKK